MRWPSIEVGPQPVHWPGADQPFALRQAPRHGQDQGHGHVGGVLGQDAWRVGDRDVALPRRLEIDMVDAGAEGGDQLQLGSGLGEDRGVDMVGDRGHQHVGGLGGLDQRRLGHRPVVQIEPGLEQLHHPGFDRVRQLPGHDHEGFLRHGLHRLELRRRQFCGALRGFACHSNWGWACPARPRRWPLRSRGCLTANRQTARSAA